MAQSLHSIELIIKKTYALQVAVRCTPGAEAVCKKNNLTFCDLLEPFSHLTSQSKALCDGCNLSLPLFYLPLISNYLTLFPFSLPMELVCVYTP